MKFIEMQAIPKRNTLGELIDNGLKPGDTFMYCGSPHMLMDQEHDLYEITLNCTREPFNHDGHLLVVNLTNGRLNGLGRSSIVQGLSANLQGHLL